MGWFLALRRAIWVVLILAPLLPVLALVVHRQSGKYRVHPWMDRLAVLLLFQLLVNWVMLGTALNGIHNDWQEDLSFLPEMMISLWVLAGVGRFPLPRIILLASAGLMAICATLDATQVGLEKTWPLAWTVASILLLGLCIWQLVRLMIQRDLERIWNQPAFWLLGPWSLLLGADLTFFPLHNYFLKHLSRTWIVVPWFAKYLIGLILNLGIARTFLCPKPSSS